MTRKKPGLGAFKNYYSMMNHSQHVAFWNQHLWEVALQVSGTIDVRELIKVTLSEHREKSILELRHLPRKVPQGFTLFPPSNSDRRRFLQRRLMSIRIYEHWLRKRNA